ncbi:MAG: ORF6N domain-containing protein, partial [Flavobacteriales bacterium]
MLRRSMNTGNLMPQRMENMEKRMVKYDLKFDEINRFMTHHELPQHGIFFENQIFDAYAFFSNLVTRAKHSIILIDNCIDHTVLLQLAKRNQNVTATIYTERIPAALQLDLAKHNAQYPHISIHRIKQVHDRFLIIDSKELYHIGASIKDLGKRWFAFSRMDSLAE